MAKDDGISGLQKAAILLIVLGPERSASIFKHLKEEEIEELTLEIANTRSVTPQVKEDILNEFYEVCLAQQYIAEGGITYAKELLEKALGNEKAMDVIGKLTASLQVKPFEFVRKTDASQLLNFIQDEHPQTIALILSYLSAGQSAMIISALPPEKQADVARRIAVMDRTSPDVIKEVEKVLKKIYTKKAPEAIGPYSQAILFNELLFSSGQIPVDPAVGEVVQGDITAQAEQVMKNVGAVLEEAGTDFASVIKTTCFLSDMGDFAAFNEVYGKYFTGKPARSCVAVKALPKNVLCEVEVIAAVEKQGGSLTV